MFNHIIFIKIVHNNYVYDNFILTEDYLKPSVEVYLIHKTHTVNKVEISADGILVHYFLRELRYGSYYRRGFIEKYFKKYWNGAIVQVILLPVNKEIIDYKWNYRMDYLVRERCELEHTLSWLSTLGGAFSALGDYFVNCAETAGKISLNQLKLAVRLNDPNIVSRCRLYLSLSLIQRRRFKLARSIVYNEYVVAKNSSIVDFRLINMCRGIWCKLKYDYELFKREKCVY
ncbi:hypothetical protein RN001_010692 [Aquatica leii]|uniref:Uncharacterized protein n=1 Tax=Aquatica leii TaxID=1421715 RepID=A0AAN7PA10_9COLE|nr:hypothetical protein RN001_010692 [Aquatica leii]